MQEIMRGVSKNIPAEDEIWVIVYPYNDIYYPQDKKVTIQNDQWSVPVGIGTEDTVGKFDIIAVLADKKAQDEFNNYFKTCEETGLWPGMEKLPDTAKEYDRVTVERKPINITYPTDGAQVNMQESVKGTYESIPEGKELWILIFPYKSYNYHPVTKVSTQDGTSDFIAPVTIGTYDNIGVQFDIIAVLADKNAQEEFTSYLKTAPSQNYPGIAEIPDGAKEYDRVTVIRK